MEKIIIKLNIRNEPKLMCIVTVNKIKIIYCYALNFSVRPLLAFSVTGGRGGPGPLPPG